MAEPRAQRWGNLRVPYTAMWTGEAECRSPSMVWEKLPGQPRIRFLSEGINRPGDGKPLFKVLHGDRTRHVVGRRICQMCVQPLPPIVVGINQGQNDLGMPLLSDGLPMCPACALEAHRACPGMQRQEQVGDLRFWRMRRGEWLMAPVLLAVRSVANGGDDRVNALLRAAKAPVFTGPKLVATDFMRIDLGTLRKMAGA